MAQYSYRHKPIKTTSSGSPPGGDLHQVAKVLWDLHRTRLHQLRTAVNHRHDTRPMKNKE